MNIDEFWAIVDDVHQESGGDMVRKCGLLRARLLALEPAELASFVEHFDDCDARAYNNPVWGAVFTLNGGCSDDSFQDFRGTLVSMGRAAFERVLAKPDDLADLELPDDLCFEGYQYVPSKVSRFVLGTRRMKTQFPANPTGPDWREEDLPVLYPKLTALQPEWRRAYRARRGLRPL